MCAVVTCFLINAIYTMHFHTGSFRLLLFILYWISVILPKILQADTSASPGKKIIDMNLENDNDVYVFISQTIKIDIVH